MIKPKHNKPIRWFFHHYIINLVQRNFHNVNFNAIAIDKNKSALLLANHFSWWDGFLMYYINHKLLKKRYHVMVIEETVKNISFFKYMGAFSISKNSKDILTSLSYAAELLNDPENMVLIFPQGKLYSNFVDEVAFEKGLQRITEKAAGKFQIIQAATFIESLEHKKPTANVYLSNNGEAAGSLAEMRDNYRQHYQNGKALQTQITV